MMRLYDIIVTVGAVTKPKNVWGERNREYDEPGAWQCPNATDLWVTCPISNAGYFAIGGKKVVATQGSTYNGHPPIAPGESRFFGDVDLRHVWFDGTNPGEKATFAYKANCATTEPDA